MSDVIFPPYPDPPEPQPEDECPECGSTNIIRLDADQPSHLAGWLHCRECFLTVEIEAD